METKTLWWLTESGAVPANDLHFGLVPPGEAVLQRMLRALGLEPSLDELQQLLFSLLRRQQALVAEILAATEHALAAEGFAGGQGLTFRVFAEVMAGLRER